MFLHYRVLHSSGHVILDISLCSFSLTRGLVGDIGVSDMLRVSICFPPPLLLHLSIIDFLLVIHLLIYFGTPYLHIVYVYLHIVYVQVWA